MKQLIQAYPGVKVKLDTKSCCLVVLDGDFTVDPSHPTTIKSFHVRFKSLLSTFPQELIIGRATSIKVAPDGSSFELGAEEEEVVMGDIDPSAFKFRAENGLKHLLDEFVQAMD